MAGPPVYEDGLFELSIDPSYNSLNSTFKTQRRYFFILYSKVMQKTLVQKINFSCQLKVTKQLLSECNYVSRGLATSHYNTPLTWSS
jgi:hypothetical protein